MVINPKSRWHCVQREMKFHPHLSLEKCFYSEMLHLTGKKHTHQEEAHS